jgi:hypothetical protein
MAIVQISRIQIRRGLNQDLPQLASAEMGWSLDTQQLYIGNGTITEGAPTAGVTEILTEHSNILNLVGLYTYQGAAAGYTVVTGVDSTHPITRSFQGKLDDIVSVRDFGAVGDGTTNDTAAINRAIKQIYSITYNDNTPKVRRTIYFPAGTYLVSTTVLIPPYASFRGDGRQNTILSSANVTAPILKTTDSQFNGTGSTTSRDLLIEGIGLQQTGNASLITSAAMMLDGTKAARFMNMSFRGNTTANASLNNLVYITDTVSSVRSVTFDQCSFTYAGSGVNIVAQSSGISSVRIDNCYFDNLSNVAYYTSNSVAGISTINNYYGTVGAVRKVGFNGNLSSIGGISGTTPTGLILGHQQTNTTQVVAVATGAATVITTLANGAGSFDYQLDNGTLYRYGTFNYTNTGSAVTFEDSYTETGSGLSANLFANATGNLSITTGTAATLKYNLKQYITFS